MDNVNEKKLGFEVQVPLYITAERIDDLLCSAFEGGANYWASITLNGSSKENTYFELVEQGKVEVEDYEEGETYPLTVESIEKALKIMGDKYDWHLKNIINENDDGETGDVLLQCAVLGDIVYG
jgi:hypothetical protein